MTAVKRVARWRRKAPKFWTANIEPLSINCHGRVQPIIHSTNEAVDSSFFAEVSALELSTMVCWGAPCCSNHCYAALPHWRTVHTYCGLTDCSGNSPELVFFALEDSNIFRQLQVFHIAFLFSLLPFLSRLSSGIKNKLVTQTNFAQPSVKSKTAL